MAAAPPAARRAGAAAGATDPQRTRACGARRTCPRRRPSRTISRLGAAVGSRPSTLTSVLDRLERRGHIVRAKQVGDRRSVRIELTESGRPAASRIRDTLAGLESRALNGLSAETVAGFRTVLDALGKEGP
ncbi:MarR family transcriptional regulator [Streptomyces sp. BR123]|uniref:MarR family winged helix-turn-helix transcriptional regulator n=1 Tax=Streptomyces sp. BR123 TaxID=2749828 RepID=UPI001C4ED686|nr:MarR family transcriptional regulator [Streptomyces sp. BR123]